MAGAKVHDLFKALKIQVVEQAHPAVFTVEAMMPYMDKFPVGAKPVKNLFLKDKKKGHFLVTALVDSKTDFKVLGSALGLGSGSLRMADEKDLVAICGVGKGAASPFCVANDAGNKATFVLDARIQQCAQIIAHPNHNEASVSIKVADLIKFAEHCKHPPTFVEFEVDPTAPSSDVGPGAGAARPASAPAAGGKGWDQADELGSAVFYRLMAGAGGGAEAPAPAAKAAAPAAPAKTAEQSEKAAKRSQTAKGTKAGLQAKKEKQEEGKTKLGMSAKKAENFSDWYTDVITKAEMIEYYDVSGCYILRPWSFFIWEQIQGWFDCEIKKLGVQNSYFPLFVKKDALETEKSHVEGFAAEVAWVTKSGSSDLAEPIAIRPTSETIMYPAYAKWIRSHRDLPMKLNQWTSVVRWEFKQPTPFLRTREFLWQEGHTAHATTECAEKMVYDALDLYAKVYEDLLACPVCKGIKSEEEKFAGGHMTTTVEGFIPAVGRGIQGATSHHLGQNFSKMFQIKFEDKNKESQFVHQTSWGITTRTIGVMVMNHSDDKGLVLPPRVAPLHVVMMPIPKKDFKVEDMEAKLDEFDAQIRQVVWRGAPLRSKVDAGTSQTPGWKFSHWELKGVPLRIELGARDWEKKVVTIARRDTGEKVEVEWSKVATEVPKLLDAIQTNLFQTAKKKMDDAIVRVTKWEEVTPALNQRKLVLAPWCEDPETEKQMKKKSNEEALELQTEDPTALTGAMKSLCIPLKSAAGGIWQPDMKPGTKCFFSGKPAKRYALFGRSY